MAFDLTVMRSARQGFFDVVVNFEDIFCSAKFDCQYPDTDADLDLADDAINLLFDETGTRRDTGVLAFACSSGTAGGLEVPETYLYLDDVTVSCSDGDEVVWTETLDAATDEPGNQFFPPRPMASTTPNALHCVCGGGEIDVCSGEPCDTGVGGRCNAACMGAGLGGVASATCEVDAPACDMAAPVFQYATYHGSEFIGADFTKAYWNLAIGFNVAAMEGYECTLTTRASASGDDGDGNQGLIGNATAPGTVYPYIAWTINLNDPGRPGTGLTCGQNPVGPAPQTLFFGDSGVRPLYTALPLGTVTFDNCGHDDGGGFATHVGPCDPVIDPGVDQ